MAIADAIEKLEKADAKGRQKAGGAKGGKGASSGKTFTGASPKEDRSRDRIAARVGTSAPTLAKARVVVQAAEDEPEKYQSVKDEMDRTGLTEVLPADIELIEWPCRADDLIPVGTVRRPGPHDRRGGGR